MNEPRPPAAMSALEDPEPTTLLDLAEPLISGRWWLLVVAVAGGVAGYGASRFMDPVFVARTTFLPPQQQQNSAASTLAQLGALSGLAGGSAAMRSPADQYVALMQSATVQNRLIDEFNLLQVYKVRHRVDARAEMEKAVRIGVGKKDGLISIDVSDSSPQRAADLANRHVEELRRVTSQLALTEAQQRRVFFEAQMKQTQQRLAAAQAALQAGGYDAGALRSEPKAAADTYARVKAEVSAAEVRLQVLRQTLTDAAAEVQQQQSTLAALRAQLARLEGATGDGRDSANYVSRYREFKYQETLFDLLARQFELARVDESKEGALIQVVDPAMPPELPVGPRRMRIAVAAGLSALLATAMLLVLRHLWRRSAHDPRNAQRMARLRAAWRGRRATTPP